MFRLLGLRLDIVPRLIGIVGLLMLTLPRSGHVEWPSGLLQGLRRTSRPLRQAEHSNMFRARLGVHVQVAGFAVWGLVPRSSLLSRLGEQPPAGPRTHGSGIHRLT